MFFIGRSAVNICAYTPTWDVPGNRTEHLVNQWCTNVVIGYPKRYKVPFKIHYLWFGNIFISLYALYIVVTIERNFQWVSTMNPINHWQIWCVQHEKCLTVHPEVEWTIACITLTSNAKIFYAPVAFIDSLVLRRQYFVLGCWPLFLTFPPSVCYCSQLFLSHFCCLSASALRANRKGVDRKTLHPESNYRQGPTFDKI